MKPAVVNDATNWNGRGMIWRMDLMKRGRVSDQRAAAVRAELEVGGRRFFRDGMAVLHS